MSQREEALEQWINQCNYALEQGLAPPLPSGDVPKKAASEVVLGLSTLQSVWPGQSRHCDTSESEIASLRVPATSELYDNHSFSNSRRTEEFCQLGKFKLIEKLGEGGFGMVFKALDTLLGRQVALKLPRNKFDPDQRRAARFRREAESLARCDHIGIVPILEAGQIEGELYMASHLCQGPSLATWLATRVAEVPAKQAAAIALQLARGLAHAHAVGIVHRDLKPSNILLDGGSDEAPKAPLVRITDFGLASWTEEDERNTATGELFGTVNYMSPEQVAGNKTVDHCSDIFSLGSIIYEMLAGRPPHASDSLIDSLRSTGEDIPVRPRQLHPTIPKDLETICLRCLEKRPQDRYEDCERLAADLAAFLDGSPIQARPVGLFERLIKWGRRQPLLAMLTVVILLLLMSGIVTTTAFSLSLYRSNSDLRAEKESALVVKEAARAALVRSQAARIELASESQRFLSSSQARETFAQLAETWDPDQRDERSLWAQAKSNMVAAHAEADFRLRSWNQPGERLLLPIQTDPSGNCLIAACQTSGRIVFLLCRLLDGETNDWQQVFELPEPHSPRRILVSDNAQTIAYMTGSMDAEVVAIRWNSEGIYAQERRIPVPRDAPIALSRQGDTLAWASGNSANMVSIGREAEKQTVAVKAQINAFAFTDDSVRLAIANGNRVAVWNLSRQRIERQLEHENPAAVRSVGWGRKGQKLLTGREDFNAYLWQLDCPERPLAKLQGFQGWIRHVSFLTEDLALVGGEFGCMLFELHNSRVIRKSPGLVASSWDRGILLRQGTQFSLYELEEFGIRQTATTGETNIATCSINRPLLVTADYDSVQVWNRDRQKLVHEISVEEAVWVAYASSDDDARDLVLVMNSGGVYAHAMHHEATTCLLSREDFVPFGLTYSEPRGELIWLDTNSQLNKMNVFTGSRSSIECGGSHEAGIKKFWGSISISQCGDFVAIADNSLAQISVFQLSTSTQTKVIPLGTEVLSIAVQESAHEIAIGTSKEIVLLTQGNSEWISAGTLSFPEATWLAYDKYGRLHFAVADGTIGIDARMNSFDERLTFRNGSKPLSSCISTDGSILYSVGRNLKLYRWNLEGMRLLVPRSAPSNQPVVRASTNSK